jgi:hypothetical protein
VSEERTTKLVQSCLDVEVLKHPGGMICLTADSGHFIPNAANYRNDIIRFVERNLPVKENTPEN